MIGDDFIPVLVVYDGKKIPVIPRGEHDDVENRKYDFYTGKLLLLHVEAFVEKFGYIPDVIIREFNILSITFKIPTRETYDWGHSIYDVDV